MEQIGDLTLIKELGNGTFGHVYLSRKANYKILYATKKINREQIESKPKLKEFLDTEITIMTRLNHPNIINLIETIETDSFYYIVMEYANGGDLNQCLKEHIKKYHRPFPEEIVQYLMRQIVEAIAYIHSYNVIHRDLKLQNIMVNFDSEKDKQDLNMMKAKIKIIDFGVSKIAPQAFTIVGSKPYMDPKILIEYANKEKLDKLRPYSQEVDIWSLGCICYALFMGKLPFQGETEQEIINKIENGAYELRTNVSPELKDFLSRMLRYNVDKRLTAKELLNHSFLVKNPKDFGKVPIDSPINPKVDAPKISNYFSPINSDKDIQNTHQPETISFSPKNQNISKLMITYGNNTELTSYRGIPMTSKNLEPNMQTKNFQSGQSPFPQFNGSYMSIEKSQEENTINETVHF